MEKQLELILRLYILSFSPSIHHSALDISTSVTARLFRTELNFSIRTKFQGIIPYKIMYARLRILLLNMEFGPRVEE